MENSFIITCNNCGDKIELKDKFNQAEDNTNKKEKIGIFSLLNGEICICCSCGNEIYSEEVY